MSVTILVVVANVVCLHSMRTTGTIVEMAQA